MTLRHTYGFAAALLLALAPATAGTLAVSGGWLRALPADLPAGGYFTLHNGGGKAVTLTGATSAGCGMIMLHKSEKIGGMDHMSMVESLDIAPGATLEFKPGGYHLMCMQPALKAGTTVPVTLHFADGAEVKADFAVRGAAGK
jgi:periplasmic copper chaperone A